MPTLYFWKDGELLEYTGPTGAESVPSRYYGLHCLDVTRTDPKLRFGTYYEGGWEPVPFEDFPAAFKSTTLLLA